LRDPAREDRAHAQLAANCLGMLFLSLVAESGVSRHHLQTRQLRQAVDEAIGNAVAQVFGVWVIVGVHEWPNCQRVYRFPASPGPSVEPARSRERGQHGNCSDPEPGPAAPRPSRFRRNRSDTRVFGLLWFF
jgi:hypothetical protein